MRAVDGTDRAEVGRLDTSTVDEFPASFAQERLWFFSQLVPDLAVYNLGCPYDLDDLDPRLDSACFEAAFAAVVQRHESLRTSLALRDERLVQLVHQSVAMTVEYTDLRGLPAAERAPRAFEIAVADSAVTIPLDTAPLWRARLIRRGDDDWLFVFVVHHAIFDAQSVRNFTAELYECYRALRLGRSPQLPDLPIQYADFSTWQRTRMADGDLDDQFEFWKAKLAQLPEPLGLPAFGAGRDRSSARNLGADTSLTIPPHVGVAIGEFGRARATTPFVILLSAFAALLHRVTGETDFIVGSPVSGRVQPELAPIIGMFVNTIMLRIDCSGNPTFGQLVGRVRETVLDALDHQEIPYDRLVEMLAADRVADGSPLHQVVFNMLPLVYNTQIRNGTAKVDLLVDLAEEEPGGYSGQLEYRRALFDDAAADAFAGRLCRLLESALSSPDRPIGTLPLLDPAERRRILAGAASPSAAIREPESVTELFGARAAANPSAVAVMDTSGGRLTYLELDRKANQLARHLASVASIKPDTRIALHLETGVGLAVAALAVLKAGAAYLPLDQQHPSDRMLYLIQDAQVTAVITDASSVHRLPATEATVIDIDAGAEAIDSRPTHPLITTTQPDALAYVIYTSGSTGRPKGVGVTRRNLAAYLDGLRSLLRAEPGHVFTLLQPLTFDFSATMFYGALITGGALFLVPRELATDAQWLIEHLRRDEVDYLKVTPSHLRALQAGGLDPAVLLPRRMLMLGGEASDSAWFRALRAIAGKAACLVVNHYGPTEATVGAVALPGDRDPQPDADFTPLGWPLAWARAYVLDEGLEPVPDGVIGELHLGGATVARGYLGRPGLTASRFLPDPFAELPGARLYRTGDRARRLPDGSIEFLGRLDDQVKVRGYRVEPDEVRHVLAAHPSVADCVVVPYGDARRAEVQLIAYIVAATGTDVDPAQLNAFMTQRVPEFMVPTVYRSIDALPLAAHGKVDRSQLPPPVTDDPPQVGDPPVGTTEELVASLFALLLGRSGFGRGDGFFLLGGHSLLAIQLVTRLRASFGIGLPLRAVFEDPSVAGVARQVEVQLGKRGRRLPPIERGTQRRTPVSFGQRRLWFLDQLEDAGPLYNTNIRHRVYGRLDTTILELALVEIVRRHDVLRSRFISEQGEVSAVVVDEPEVPFDRVDVSAYPAEVRQAEVDRAMERHASPAIDLGTQPPLRALVVKVSDTEHVLLVTMHHVVNDAWSAVLLMQELGTLYTALSRSEPSPLAPLSVQYADFAAWQRELVTGPLRDTQIAYWHKQLAAVPERLDLPTDQSRPARRGYAGDHVQFQIPDDLIGRLRAVGADENASLFMVLLTAFAVLLSRYTGREDIVIGTPAANRPRPELEPLIGFFLNTLALRTDCSGDPTFREFLCQVRATTLDALSNQDVPFEVLIDELAVSRDLGGTPLVQVLFTLEDSERTPIQAGDIEFRWEPFGTPTSKFDITLYLWRRAGRLSGVVEYRTDLFDAATMQRFARHYCALLSAAAQDPDRPVSRLPILSADDEERIDGWNSTGVVVSGPVSLGGWVASRVVESAQGLAVGWGGGWLSYRDFAGRVDRVVGVLRGRGVGVGDVVGVCVPRGLDLVVAVHAVVAAGGAYLALEPEYPDERLAFMVADAGVRLVITDRSGAGRLCGVEVWCLGEEGVAADGGGSPSEVVGSGQSLAYVLYTSGSTGVPKGVGVSHAAIVNRLRWMQQTFPLDGTDRVLHKTPFSFDVSVWELFWPLMAGAGLVVAQAGGQRDPTYLAGVIEAEQVTTVHFVPSMLDVFLDQPDLAARCRSLRRVFASGEALSPALVARFYQVLPGVELHNLYGPTEAAVDVTWHACRPGEARTPIGRPVANTGIEVLDTHGERVPIGTPGELCIAGVQLALGYLNRPGLTAERFVPNPYGPAGSRLYRTGDLARWLPDGEVDYLGRIDHQVKIRGLRVELGEIEACLNQQPEVRTCAVLAHSERSTVQLVAYLVATTDHTTDPDLSTRLQDRLRRRLPEHMIPRTIIMLDELPTTPNGKLNRAALPSPQPHPDRPHTPPHTTEEQHIAQTWSDVLGINDISTDDDFFALGGDSIHSLKVIARLRNHGYNLALQSIFEHPTVRQLAAQLATGPTAETVQPARSSAFSLVDQNDLAILERIVAGRAAERKQS